MHSERIREGLRRVREVAGVAKDILLIPHTVPSSIRRERRAPLETKALMAIAEGLFIGAPAAIAVGGVITTGDIGYSLGMGAYTYGAMILGVGSVAQG
ncbi:hypothetical protein A3C59_01570 [Candidatus Daviesbacteria bacterium RIFCSPHIGHO2_02_FULL_36_13]|uniref:Uncharacterized protein n=1 Tax=Candidatus Daviesbacteria bacterium RIFCSPHIGHO2_02_FULL_36_13 TaxID=1797768 RepID=A0A1F5JVN5_9BACT|nr:MAG: hypothetical protein A3C59_01570 [Candidatus Daviesbacteria bacterium RIFCSPHIGHO2_02_FULL_36_13]